MRYLTFLMILLMTPWFASAQAQPDRTQLYLVKTWRLTGTWTYTKHTHEIKVEGDVTTTHTYDAEIWAQAQFRLVQSKNHSSKRYRWQVEKGSNPEGYVSMRVVDFAKIKPKNGEGSWAKTEIDLEGKAFEGDGRLDIDPADGTCKVVAGFLSAPGTIKTTGSKGGSIQSESPFYFSSGTGEVKGQAAGMRFGGFSPDGTSNVPRERPDLNPISFEWQISPWEQNPEGEATFDLADHDWRPKVDSATTVEIKWKGKAEKVKLTLSGISREPGTCLNSEDTNQDEDLVIEKQGQWEVHKEGSDAALQYIALRILPKKDPPESVSLELKAKDYGAYGKLQCEVLLDGKWRNAKAAGAESLNVPYDANDNHIADAWEKQEGVTGYPETWDEAEVEGQTAKGDGLTLYAKYRGVRTADKDWTELKAKEKAHFIIDASGIFDAERWYNSTHIRAYKLAEGMTQDRKVDFNARTAAGSGKYAVRLERISGTKDTTTDASGNPKTDDAPTQYAYTKGEGTPRTTELCRIFPDRIRGMLDRVTSAIRSAVTDPVVTADALKERTFLLSLGFTQADLQARLTELDGGQRDVLVQKLVVLSAIHEMGHACGVPGHLDSSSSENEDVQRVQSCPSQYMDKKGRRFLLLRGQTTGDGPFCKAAPDNCWSYLNIKD